MTNEPFDIRPRLKRLKRTQVALLMELKKTEGLEKVTTGDLSNTLSGIIQTARSQLILSRSNEIVSEWERQTS